MQVQGSLNVELEPGPEIRGLFLQIPDDPEAETSGTSVDGHASVRDLVEDGGEEAAAAPAIASSLSSISMTGSEENPLSDTTRYVSLYVCMCVCVYQTFDVYLPALEREDDVILVFGRLCVERKRDSLYFPLLPVPTLFIPSSFRSFSAPPQKSFPCPPFPPE